MMKYIYPSLFLFSIMFAQHNPIQTATAGAFNARSFGNHAIQNNPAFLGIFGEKIVLGSVETDSLISTILDTSNTQENDSNIVFIDSLINYYSVQLIANPNRKIVKNFIDSGVNLGVSSRAMGSVVQCQEGSKTYNLVQDDLRLATAADIVADPSAPGAFVEGIMENKEWLFVEGKYVEVDIDHAKKQIRKATPQQIEEVALNLFNNYLSKL